MEENKEPVSQNSMNQLDAAAGSMARPLAVPITHSKVLASSGNPQSTYMWRWTVGLAFIGLWIRVEIGLREARDVLAADVREASYTLKLNEEGAIVRIAQAISEVRNMPSDLQEALREAQEAMREATEAKSMAESANYDTRQASDKATKALEEAERATRLAESATWEADSATRRAKSAENAAGSAMSEALETKRAISPSPFDLPSVFRRR